MYTRYATLIALSATLLAVLSFPLFEEKGIPMPEIAREQTATPSLAEVAGASTDVLEGEKKPVFEPKKEAPVKTNAEVTDTATTTGSNNEHEARRLINPYTSVPLSFDDVNTITRSALVNILCNAPNGVISGSGIVIDTRGVIVTNAHVAQYVLLSKDPGFGVECTVRAGSPARPIGSADILFLPQAWIDEHAKDITVTNPLGTGENDFALLLLRGIFSGTPLSFDSREAIGFLGDRVLIGSYPAGFLGSIETQKSLHAASTIGSIQDLFTFGDANAIDLLSLGGVIVAQSGSSGGAVVNQWGKLIAIASTASTKGTTAERDLRAITFAHIDRVLARERSTTLSGFLTGNIEVEAATFAVGPQIAYVHTYRTILTR